MTIINKKLKFVFWGTPDVAHDTLEILKENGYLPSLIITSPDKPQGRKMIITPPPVKIWAIENNILYIQPEKLNNKEVWGVLRTLSMRDDSEQKKILAENFSDNQNIPELFIVVAYGKIIPKDILTIPKLGSVNIHYSLLPKYRGASPVESAILNGDTETGITIQQMKYKMDSGPIISQEKIEILPEEKALELRKRLIKIGGKLLIKTLPDLINGKIKSIFQDEDLATYCKKIKKEDGLVVLGAELPKTLYNKFRAYATWPRTYFFENEKRIIITDAILEKNNFIIKKVIPEGKKEINYKN